ncbi:MAG: glycosyltransferase family 2 protein [Phycisphaerales bacterium]|nr:glycosyltransferase family 2 protein [Phycisphaerales bacterium]
MGNDSTAQPASPIIAGQAIAPPMLSLIAPAHNEEGNIARLVEQCGAALQKTGLPFEFIIVDDGSTDQTAARVRELLPSRPWLRCIQMTQTPVGKGNGQSAAFYAGIRASSGSLIATIDADLQNDPADLSPMLELMRATNADMVQGDRSRSRKDNVIRKVSSKVGRLFRAAVLSDVVRDTGCSLRIMKREPALRLPLEFRGMHRFIPVSFALMGYRVEQREVGHRPRVAGTSKYGMGVLSRALPGFIDLLAVRWMASRRRPVSTVELERGAAEVGTKTVGAAALESVAITASTTRVGARA